jgi:hypothetical protein
LISPISPVRRTCVPPHADTSQSGISTMRIRPVTAGGLPQREPAHTLVVDPVPQHLAVVPYDGVRRALDPLDRAPVGGAQVDLDRAAFVAEPRRLGRGAELALERGRQDVLARVHLHVIEAARPVDLGRRLAGDGGGGAFCRCRCRGVTTCHTVPASSVWTSITARSPIAPRSASCRRSRGRKYVDSSSSAAGRRARPRARSSR